jgi:putative phosphoesterase
MLAAKTRERFVHRQAALSLRDDGGLRLVIVADTHSLPHPESARHIAALRPDAILHAGDIGDLGVLDGLARLAPLVAVRGNIDTRAPDLPDAVTIDLRSAERSVMTILLLHIAVYGAKIRADAARLARASAADLVVCGHSHVPFAGRDRGLVVFNPGSIGPRRFRLPIVFGVLEIAANEMKVHHVDCETGEPWAP